MCCCISRKNKTGQLMKGCPVCCFHIINLHKTNRKRVRKADCPSRTVCRTQKSRFLHESASLEPENANVWHPPDALFRKQKEGCKHDLICSSTMINPACISWLTLLRQQFRMVRWGAMQSRREISTHIAERVFRIHAAHPNSACMLAQKLRLQKTHFSQLFKFRIS